MVPLRVPRTKTVWELMTYLTRYTFIPFNQKDIEGLFQSAFLLYRQICMRDWRIYTAYSFSPKKESFDLSLTMLTFREPLLLVFYVLRNG